MVQSAEWFSAFCSSTRRLELQKADNLDILALLVLLLIYTPLAIVEFRFIDCFRSFMNRMGKGVLCLRITQVSILSLAAQ